MNPDVVVPKCSCGHAGGEGMGLHADDCKRWVAIVRKYNPRGLRVERGKVVRD